MPGQDWYQGSIVCRLDSDWRWIDNQDRQSEIESGYQKDPLLYRDHAKEVLCGYHYDGEIEEYVLSK